MAESRSILHADLDAFFASIEQLDGPELRGRPVLVGGAGPRGVVAAASYEARAFGCRSAQPMSVARRCCPQAIVVPPRGGRYREASRRFFAILESVTPLVEPLSIDEAFLDVTGSRQLHGAAAVIAADLRRRIREAVGVPASIGAAPNKFLAKLASTLAKPDGLKIIEPDEIERTIAALAIEHMWGVGPVTARKLRALGVTTFADLRSAPLPVLQPVLGAAAPRIVALARGEDGRAVVPDHQARSLSQEQTFALDVEEPDAVRSVLLVQVEHVGRRLRRAGLRGQTVRVKIRFGEFRTITRSRTLDAATDSTDRLWAAAADLFDRWAATAFRPVRLIGFGAAGLTAGGGQAELFAPAGDERRRALDRVTDEIETRFGPGTIGRAVGRSKVQRDQEQQESGG